MCNHLETNWMNYKPWCISSMTTEIPVLLLRRLADRDTDNDLNIDGFGTPISLDHDSGMTGKTQSREVCLYINELWCHRLL